MSSRELVARDSDDTVIADEDTMKAAIELHSKSPSKPRSSSPSPQTKRYQFTGVRRPPREFQSAIDWPQQRKEDDEHVTLKTKYDLIELLAVGSHK